MKQLSLILVLLLVSLVNAYAGGGGITDTGGGDAVVSGDSVRMLDLAEKEGFVIESLAAYNDELLPRLEFIEQNYLNLHRKVNVSRDVRYVHNFIADAIGRTNWFYVDGAIPELNDEGVDIYYQEVNGQKVQLALQYRNNVFVRRDLFMRMNEADQGALLFHELVLNHYLNNWPESLSGGTAKIRTFVSLMFAKNYDRLSFQRVRAAYRNIGGLEMMPREYLQTKNKMMRAATLAAFKTDLELDGERIQQEFTDSHSSEIATLTNPDVSKQLPAPFSVSGTVDKAREEYVLAVKAGMEVRGVRDRAPTKVVEFVDLLTKRPDLQAMISERTLGEYQYLYKIEIVNQATAYNNRGPIGRLFSSSRDEESARILAAFSTLKLAVEDVNNALEAENPSTFKREFTK